MDEAINEFIDDVNEILADDETPSDTGVDRLVERMRALVRDPEVLSTHQEFIGAASVSSVEPSMFIDVGRRSQILYTDHSGLTLVRSRFDPDEPTPVHSHGTWGVVGVYAGRDRHQAWRRLDDGVGAGYARLELLEERVLEPGDVVVIPHPPQDIHAQQGAGEDTYEFVLFGKNAMEGPRLYFDPEAKTAKKVLPKKD
jgi:predicted metal-dependent enzyme (double-stranded beta helix superfamily)